MVEEYFVICRFIGVTVGEELVHRGALGQSAKAGVRNLGWLESNMHRLPAIEGSTLLGKLFHQHLV